ncbi:MAG: hypothetical protein ACI9O4_000921 [Chitinophagales bacterium]|jgi:hypothetical protein
MLNLDEDLASTHLREMATYFNAKLDEGNDASTITMDNEAKGFVRRSTISKPISLSPN